MFQNSGHFFVEYRYARCYCFLLPKWIILPTEILDHLVRYKYAISFYGIRSYSFICMRTFVTFVTPKSLQGPVPRVANQHAKNVRRSFPSPVASV